MKEEIMQRLSVILNVLNSIPVNGKQNLANMSGSIVCIEEIIGMLSGVEIVEQKGDTKS